MKIDDEPGYEWRNLRWAIWWTFWISLVGAYFTLKSIGWLNRFLLIISCSTILMGCASPGITVYGDSQVVVDAKGSSKLANSKLVAINADVTGDVEVPGRLYIRTPRDANGNVLVAKTAVLSKDKLQILGWEERPLVAEIRTTPVYVAFFRGVQSWLNSIGTTAVSAIGLGAAGQVSSAGAAALKP